MRRKTRVIFFVCIFTILCNNINAQNFIEVQKKESSRYLFGELSNSYNAELWSFTISKSNEFLRLYPFSIYKNDVLLYMGESLFFLDQLDDALVIFENLVSTENTTDKIRKKAGYWLGRILSVQEEHTKALEYLYFLVQEPFNDTALNKDVLFYSARSLSALRRHTELTAVIEYYIKNYTKTSAPSEIIPLLGNLWLGMGIDAFKQAKFEEAQEYFRRADAQKLPDKNTSAAFELSGLYQASIQYMQGFSLNAITILENRIIDGSAFELDYLAFLSILYGEAGQWDICEKYSFATWKLATMDGVSETFFTSALFQKSAYWYAVCLFRKENYAETAQVLKTVELIRKDLTTPLDSFTQLLYAQSLYLSGDSPKGLAIFTNLFPTSSETAKALFLSKEWTAALESSRLSGDKYIEGLTRFQIKDWNLAAELLLSEDAKAVTTDLSWNLYYGALAQYNLGDYAASYRTMEQFLEINTIYRYNWNANMVSALCAIQQGHTTNALKKTLAAIQSARTQEQIQDSTIFASELYLEQKNYKEAIAILQDIAITRDTTSISPRLLLSKAYTAIDDLNAADNELKKIIEIFPNAPQAREAAFKRGELKFTVGEYDKAEELFRVFRFELPIGAYSDTALYYEAQSREKQGDRNGALLLYTDLLNRYKDSSYQFVSLNQLIYLYREEGEYENALKMAIQTKEQYPQEFAGANLHVQIDELKILAAGVDEQVVETLFRWQGAGENTSANGRKIGFELATLYLASSNQIDDAYEILRSIDSFITTSNTEAALHGKVLQKLGLIEREKENCREAARYYLKAAERISFANESNEYELSSTLLYGAVEAFDCAKDSADARAVYDQMNRDYPDSVWTDRAKSVLGID